MKKTILILVANPQGSAGLNLLPEVRNLQEAIQRSLNRERFAVEWRVAIQEEDLRRHILDIKPQIIHFCGHGTKEGLVIHDENNQVKLLSNEFLADLLKNFADCLECLVLNACETEPLAIEVAKHLNYAIGMNQEVKDKSAIAFAEAFYDAIGAGEGIEKAFELGKNAVLGITFSSNQNRKLTVVKEDDLSIQAQNSEHLIPVLKINPNPHVIIDKSIISDPIYIERPTIEQDCYEAIEYERLIRIKAPPRMGKTWLLNKVIEYAKEKKHYSVVEINIDEDILTEGYYTGFLQWFCWRLSDSLNFARVSWNQDNGNKLNVTNHITSILSSRVDSKLIVTISNFEVLFEFPDMFQKFCELLRSWVDSNDKSLRKLSVIIVHSTEPYILYDINSSPFGNIGKPFELLGFTNEQVRTLANRLQLEYLVNNYSSEINQLQELVNGHPELITKALKCIQNGDGIQGVLQYASTEEGIFGSHLRGQQNNLRQKPNLLEDYKKIVSNYNSSKTSTGLQSNSIFQLYGLGLVKYDKNRCWPSCELYQSYFYDILINNEQ
jgi:hypothetical protein